MPDNNKPSADQAKADPEEIKEDRQAALKIAKEHPEAVQIAEAALIRKWGAEAGEKFANEIFRVSPGMLLEVEKRLTEINAEMPKNIKNERVLHNFNRIKMRFAEFVFVRAFFAHIINHLKGIEETPENFYTAYYEILPYIEKEMQKAPDGYYMLREMDIYDGFQWSSDRRVKSDIIKLEDTDLVARLNPVEYKFTSDAAGKKHYGFIAQEVQEVMPDAVKENKNGYLGLNYLEFIAPAIAMIQRQEKEITELKAEVKALKEKTNG